MGHYQQYRSLAAFLSGYEELAAEFHLPDRLSILDLYHIFVAVNNHCRDHRQLAVHRITSYNVCYTKLLRSAIFERDRGDLQLWNNRNGSRRRL